MTRKQLLRDIALRHDIGVNDILGYNRQPHVVAARFEAYRALRESGLSLCAIGDIMKRDHTTVLHGLRRGSA